MTSLSITRFFLILTLSIIAIARAVTAQTPGDIVGGAAARANSGKDIVGGAARTVLGKTSVGMGSGPSAAVGSGSRRPQIRFATKTRTVTVTKTRIISPTTGTIVVVAEPRAVVIVESVKGGEGDEGVIPPDDRQFIFNNLRPGRYRVAAALEGHNEAQQDVRVIAGKTSAADLALQPITYNVTFNANVESGEIRYAPVVARIDPSTKQIRYDRAPGDVRLTSIVNGRAVLANLRQGTYGLDIRAEQVGYQTLLATISLPGATTIPVELKKLESTKTLSATWSNLDDWHTPSGWRVATRKLSVSGRGVALPREDDYRYYKDFQLTSDVKMLNGVAASFVVRAQDENNYYLIQLTGANADEPYMLRSFVVRNGTQRRMGPAIALDGFTSTLKANQFFTVIMKMIGNDLTLWIKDNQTGETLPLGTLSDPAANFRIGAVGIGVRDNEQNEIWRFIVCANQNQCPPD